MQRKEGGDRKWGEAVGSGGLIRGIGPTLSQSFLTSPSWSCLHWLSCSIQPSISCSIFFFTNWGEGGGDGMWYEGKMENEQCADSASSRHASRLLHRAAIWIPTLQCMRQTRCVPNELLAPADSPRVWQALHHRPRAVQEDACARPRGDQGLSPPAHLGPPLSPPQSHILAARTVANIIRTSLGPRGASPVPPPRDHVFITFCRP
jgi:hypothetical protein